MPLLALVLATACSTSISGHGPAGERVDAGEGASDEDATTPSDDAGEDGQVLVISVTPSNLALEPNETAQAIATVTGDDVGSEITWFSADKLVAVVDQNGLIRAIGDGETEVTAEVGGASNSSSASILVTVSASAQCPDGTGSNGDSCTSVYQGKDLWRCTISPSHDNAMVSQVCRDKGDGAKWITFHINPTDCCACVGTFSGSCCAANSTDYGCP